MDYIIAIPLTIITVAIIMWPITLGIIIKIFWGNKKSNKKHNSYHSKSH
jgi:hypothetical protein